jgi:general secretion pathway protein L
MALMGSVLGLDIGSHTVKAVELRSTLRGLDPVQMRVHPRADPDAPLSELLARFIRMHQLPTDLVVAALPGSRLSVRRMEFPFRDRRRLAAAVPFEVEGETPFAIEDVIVDWEMVGGDRAHAELAVCIAPRRVVAEQLEQLQEAGCEPRILEAQGPVLANLAAVYDWQEPRLLLDFGHRKTSLCLVREGKPIAARTIGVGGHHLSEAIAGDHGWSYDDAEHAKCEDGVFHLGFDSASPHAIEVLDRVAREAVRLLEGAETQLGGPATQRVGGIVMLGGSSRLHRFDEYLSERVGIAAARPNPPPEGDSAAILAAGDPALFGPALALALRGTARAQTRSNFRQDEFSYRTDLLRVFGRDLRGTAVLGGIASALFVASAATSITLESQRADDVRAEVQRLYAEALPNRPEPANPVASLRQEVDTARELADFLGVYGGSLSALDLLAELSKRVPEDLEVRFGEINITGRTVRIKVVGKDFEAAERLTAALGASAPFQNAEVKGGIERTKSGVSFSISISLTARAEGES